VADIRVGVVPGESLQHGPHCAFVQAAAEDEAFARIRSPAQRQRCLPELRSPRPPMPPPRRNQARVAPAVDVGPLEPTVPEVKQLWWFLDGAIMAPDVRRHVRRSWGFCPRHTWLFAVAEIQLRGGMPFATSILWADLTRRAAEALQHHRPWRVLLPRLNPADSCFTCEHVAIAGDDPVFLEYHERTCRLDRARERFEDVRGRWQTRSCPHCLGGEGIVCRQHLLLGAEPPDGLSGELAALSDRLDAFGASMTLRGRPVDGLGQASWVEALGWFAGWDYPAKLLR
jgi:hypothetical protein